MEEKIEDKANECWFIVALPRISINYGGRDFQYGPMIALTNTNPNSEKPNRHATSRVIARVVRTKGHADTNIGLAMNALDNLEGAECYSQQIPKKYDFDKVKSKLGFGYKRDTTDFDTRTAQEIDACYFLSNIYGGSPRSYVDRVRDLFFRTRGF